MTLAFQFFFFCFTSIVVFVSSMCPNSFQYLFLCHFISSQNKVYSVQYPITISVVVGFFLLVRFENILNIFFLFTFYMRICRSSNHFLVIESNTENICITKFVDSNNNLNALIKIIIKEDTFQIHHSPHRDIMNAKHTSIIFLILYSVFFAHCLSCVCHVFINVSVVHTYAYICCIQIYTYIGMNVSQIG